MEVAYSDNCLVVAAEPQREHAAVAVKRRQSGRGRGGCGQRQWGHPSDPIVCKAARHVSNPFSSRSHPNNSIDLPSVTLCSERLGGGGHGGRGGQEGARVHPHAGHARREERPGPARPPPAAPPPAAAEPRVRPGGRRGSLQGLLHGPQGRRRLPQRLPRDRLRERRRPLLQQPCLRLHPRRAALRRTVRAGAAAPRAPDHPDRGLRPHRARLLRHQAARGAPHPALHRVPHRRPPTHRHRQARRLHGRLLGRHDRRRHRPHLQDPTLRHEPPGRLRRHRAHPQDPPLPLQASNPAEAPAALTWKAPQVASGKDPDQALSYLYGACSLASLAVKHIDLAVAVISSFLDPKEVAETSEMADEHAYISEKGPYPSDD